MKLENKKETYRIWLQKLVATVIFTPLVMAIAFANYFDKPFFGIERTWLLVGVCSLYLTVILYHLLRNPYYILYNDYGNNINLNYYPVRAFNQKKNSIAIPKDKFVRFEIIKTMLGQKIILYQHFKSGIGKFPPVSLSALSKEEISKMKASLSAFVLK